MKQYLEEKYERMRKDNEEIKSRRESLEDQMVSAVGVVIHTPPVPLHHFILSSCHGSERR